MLRFYSQIRLRVLLRLRQKSQTQAGVHSGPVITSALHELILSLLHFVWMRKGHGNPGRSFVFAGFTLSPLSSVPCGTRAPQPVIPVATQHSLQNCVDPPANTLH